MDHRSATGRRESIWPACPFVDRNDNRCTNRFSLGHIDQAFDVCFGSYRACPMYHRLAAEAGHGVSGVANDAHDPPWRETPQCIQTSTIAITAHGRTLPLRPTGT